MSSSPYILISRLGEGGMAEVFKAMKKGPDGWEKPIALKRILPHLADNTEFIKMLSQEARLHAHLDHPNVVQILDFFRHENSYMIALEYVPGKNLRTILHDKELKRLSLPWEGAVYIFTEVLKGLDYAHKKRGAKGPMNIVHRDISPQNILISYDGVVKLSDFGIAVGNIERERTETGILKGKHRYLAPEQLERKPADAKTDIYATGIALYEVLCGQNPYQDENQFQMMKKISQGAFQSSRTYRKDIPEGIHIAIEKALQKKPADRYSEAAQFRQALSSNLPPEWLSQGDELLKRWLEKLYPLQSEREERALEKTPIMSRQGSPIPSEVNPNESLLSGPTDAPAIFMNTTSYTKLKLWSAIGFGLLIATVIIFISRSPKIAPKPIFVPPAPVSIPEPIPSPAPQIVKETKHERPKIKIAIKTSPGKIRFIGAPSGSSVLLNGNLIGNLPLNPDKEVLPPGNYLLTIKPLTGKIYNARVSIESKKVSIIRYRGE